MQKLQLVGNLGADAVIKTPNAVGESFLSFKIACTDSYTNKNGEKVENTTWYDCTYKRTNLAAFIKKGHQIYVEGRPKYSIYQDKDGNNVVNVGVSVREITLLNNKKD